MHGRKYFSELVYVTLNFFTLTQYVRHGCQVVLTVPHDHQLFLTIRNVLRIDVHPSLMSLAAIVL